MSWGVVPKEGLEPSRCCHQRILSPPRLPFRHFGPAERSPAKGDAVKADQSLD
jgi:hypothetical protein